MALELLDGCRKAKRVLKLLDGKKLSWTETYTGIQFSATYADILEAENLMLIGMMQNGHVAVSEWIMALTGKPCGPKNTYVGWSIDDAIHKYGCAFFPVQYKADISGGFKLEYVIQPDEFPPFVGGLVVND